MIAKYYDVSIFGRYADYENTSVLSTLICSLKLLHHFIIIRGGATTRGVPEHPLNRNWHPHEKINNFFKRTT